MLCKVIVAHITLVQFNVLAQTMGGFKKSPSVAPALNVKEPRTSKPLLVLTNILFSKNSFDHQQASC